MNRPGMGLPTYENVAPMIGATFSHLFMFLHLIIWQATGIKEYIGKFT